LTRAADPAAGFWPAFATATLVAGTLDILSAFLFAGIGGLHPLDVLRFVASGPFGDSLGRGNEWAAVGLLVDFAITACMVGAYLAVSPRVPALLRHPVAAGIAYGLFLWLVMNWIVVPLRWPAAPVPDSLYEISNGLFSHCILVGLPIALIAARTSLTRLPA
jgi:hypothetical protein